MDFRGSKTVYWIVGCALALLLSCLCGLILVSGGLILFASRTVPDPQQPSAFLPASKPLADQFQTIPDPELDAGDASGESFKMEELLASTVVPEVDPVELAMRFYGIPQPARTRETGDESFLVGKLAPFWVTNTSNQEKYSIIARLSVIGEHTYFWVDTAVDYNLQDAEQLVETFDQQIYPKTREIFGSEWSPGVDGDERIHILYASGMGSGVAGYFSSVDEYTPQVFEYSNSHEMFYLNADTVELDSDFTAGVLAHEFVHMILWNVDTNEQTWMNEGFAEIGATLNGYDVGGVDLVFSNNPDLALTYWAPGAGSKAAHYGQAYLFLAYFLDRFGLTTVKELFQLPSDGLESIDQVLQEKSTFDGIPASTLPADEVFRDWSIALLLQNPDLLDGRYSFESISGRMPTIQPTNVYGDCPIQPEFQQVNQYGIDYLQVRCEGDYQLIFEGNRWVPIVPMDPISGDYAMWSNRGDESNMTLTREFDLSGIHGPITLSYSTWYDIEKDYDYLYVELSEDGGETWEILQTPSGLSSDPSGNSYGWAYNGTSGTGDEAAWIKEEVDLTAYSGKEVLIRFEYITDAAVNGEGFLLDEVEIGAIGYREGFEDSQGGWEAKGFVRLFNQIPQTFQVVIVETGEYDRIRVVQLDEHQRAEIPVSFRDEVQGLTLIVIGTSRYTWQPASYQFSLEPFE
jgi:hypothetical protein